MKSHEEEEGNRVRKEGHEFQTMYVRSTMCFQHIYGKVK